jgi:hypothetical protein
MTALLIISSIWRGVAEGGRELMWVDRRCGQDHVEGELTLSGETA